MLFVMNSRERWWWLAPSALAVVVGCAAATTPAPKLEQAPIEGSGALHLDPARAEAPPVEPKDAGPADPHHVELVVGELKTMNAKDIKSFSVANANIDVRLGPDHTFIIAGKAKGRCDLLLLRRDGTQETFTFEVFAQ